MVNRLVLAVLRSRGHRLLPGLCALSFRGRRTGREIVLPVQCAREGDQVAVCVGRAAGKTWWRNFRTPTPVDVLLDGARRTGRGHVVETGRPERAAAERMYLRRHPRVRIDADDPLVLITLSGPAPQPTPGTAEGARTASSAGSGTPSPAGSGTPSSADARSPSSAADAGLWWSWWRWTTLGETLGFCVPAAAGALAGDASAVAAWPLLLGAGLAEGALLGAAQAHVLRRALPAVRPGHWIVATAAAACLAWLLGLLPTLYLPRLAWPAAAALGAVNGLLLLSALGTAQWWVLRGHVPRAHRWITATAAAWLAGLAVFCAVSMPLWHPGQSTVVITAIGALAGLLMAATVAAVTGWALVRLVNDAGTAGRP